MKSLSVHGIDKETEKTIKERATAEGKSVNMIVKELIAKSLGMGAQRGSTDKREEFVDLCGAWTGEEAAEFLERIDDLEAVDPKDWR
ncbi:MAG: hypothetical protein ABSG19_05645 [Candidatus Aminicenantales bacterium]